jgi:hypothetical protein
MPGRRAVTNSLLFLIAGALLLTVAQGRLVRLSPLFTTLCAEEATLDADVPLEEIKEEDTLNGDVGDQDEDAVPTLLSLGNRLLVYVLLMLALAYGVEAGVECVRVVLGPRRSQPGPTEILRGMKPWLPKSQLTSKEPEDTDEQTNILSGSETDSPPNPGDLQAPPLEKEKSNAQLEALRGIALSYTVRAGQKARQWGWTEVIYMLASTEQEHLRNEDRKLRLKRAIPLIVVILFASITRLNAFDILLGPDRVSEIFSQSSIESGIGRVWYMVGGIGPSAFTTAAGAGVWHDLLNKLRQSKRKRNKQHQLAKEVRLESKPRKEGGRLTNKCLSQRAGLVALVSEAGALPRVYTKELISCLSRHPAIAFKGN